MLILTLPLVRPTLMGNFLRMFVSVLHFHAMTSPSDKSLPLLKMILRVEMFENVLFLRSCRRKKTKFFKNASQSGKFWKRRFTTLLYTEQNGTFQKCLRHGMVSHARIKRQTGISFVCRFCLGFLKPDGVSWHQPSLVKCSWGGLTLSGNFHSRSRRPRLWVRPSVRRLIGKDRFYFEIGSVGFLHIGKLKNRFSTYRFNLSALHSTRGALCRITGAIIR